jgi:LysR family glycine cleavage system transcriptional activator
VNLRTEGLFPVCSPPPLVGGRRRLSKPLHLLKLLLHLDDRKDWSKWLKAAGVACAGLEHCPVLNHASMLVDAAVDGQGIALARTTLAAWDLLNRRLVRPFTTALPLSKTYWIACPKAASMLLKIAMFRDWLLAEAADDGRVSRRLLHKHLASSTGIASGAEHPTGLIRCKGGLMR